MFYLPSFLLHNVYFLICLLTCFFQLFCCSPILQKLLFLAVAAIITHYTKLRVKESYCFRARVQSYPEVTSPSRSSQFCCCFVSSGVSSIRLTLKCTSHLNYHQIGICVRYRHYIEVMIDRRLIERTVSILSPKKRHYDCGLCD